MLLETGQSLPAYPYDIALHGPRSYSTIDIRQALLQVTGRSAEIRLVDNDKLSGYFASMVPEPYASEMAEMVREGLPGGIINAEVSRLMGKTLPMSQTHANPFTHCF
jgi:hypothetical protein